MNNEVISVPIVGGMLKISDIIASKMGITDYIKHVRYSVRDECNRVTYVYDRLLGLVP